MEFQIQRISDNWLKLEKESSGVKYLGSRFLEEYEILKEILYVNTIENISCAHMKFAFRRRIEYHITNTFTQVT